MENGVVDVEDVVWVSELGGVPVVVGREDGGFGMTVNSKYVGFRRLIS